VAAEESAADEPLQVAEPAAEDVADGAAPAVGGVPDEAVVTAAELHELLEAPGGVELLVVDIRSYGANALGSVEGALSIPAGSLFELRMDEIPTDADVVLIDADGTRVAEAYGMLEASGAYDMGRVRVVCDGMDAWKEAGFELSERKVRGTC
jgi:rhodanese-related sulfurtransferase